MIALEDPSGFIVRMEAQKAASKPDFGRLRGIAGEVDQAIDRGVESFSVILCVTPLDGLWPEHH
jgi:hypothetical protein